MLPKSMRLLLAINVIKRSLVGTSWHDTRYSTLLQMGNPLNVKNARKGSREKTRWSDTWRGSTQTRDTFGNIPAEFFTLCIHSGVWYWKVYYLKKKDLKSLNIKSPFDVRHYFPALSLSHLSTGEMLIAEKSSPVCGRERPGPRVVGCNLILHQLQTSQFLFPSLQLTDLKRLSGQEG